MTDRPVPPPPAPPVSPPPHGQPEPPRKGVHPLVWVGVGCAGLVLLGLLATVVGGMYIANKVRNATEEGGGSVATVARLIAAANPDIEIVGEDEDAGTITLRQVSSGEEVTISYEDLADGRLSFTTSEGTAALDFDVQGGEDGEASMTIETPDGATTFRASTDVDIPGWVPVYPGAEPVGGFTTDTPDVTGGTYSAETRDGVDEVLDFFERELQSEGLAIKSRTTTQEGAMLTAGSDDESRSATVILGTDGGRTEIVVQYAER